MRLRRFRRWMAAGVNFLELFDADLGVNGRGVEFFVTKQLLDEPDVSSVLQHVRGARVPQNVATAFAFQSGFFQPGGDHAADHVGIEVLAVSDEASSATSHATLGATGDAAFRATPGEAPNHYPFKG